jgi:hypothetical protein
MSTHPTRESTLSQDRDASAGGYGDGDPGRFTRDEPDSPEESGTASEPEDPTDEDANGEAGDDG